MLSTSAPENVTPSDSVNLSAGCSGLDDDDDDDDYDDDDDDD